MLSSLIRLFVLGLRPLRAALTPEQVELLQQFAKLRDEQTSPRGFFDKIKEAFQ